MSILNYLRHKDGLPDPKGSLSSSISARAIARANREVEAHLVEKSQTKKRGSYRRYSCAERAEVGKYALQNGAAAAARVFSRKFHMKLSESTVRSMRRAYKSEVDSKRKKHDESEIKSLPTKKRGRSLLLGDDIDSKVQKYLTKVRESGGVVSARIAMAAARGILLTADRTRLAEFGGDVALNRHWAYSLLKRMKFVKRKATTAKSKYTGENFEEVKATFLNDVVTTVSMEDIPPELILNWDQTGIPIVPSSPWTMDRRGVKRVEMTGVSDKRQITGVFCGTLVGDFLPLQLIYGGKTARCHPKFTFPSDWHVTHTPTHWSNEETMVDYIEKIIVPYVETTRENLDLQDTPALVIMDNFKGQVTSKIHHLLEENNIHVCLLPPNTTDRLQPLDVSVNKPAKDFLKDQFQQWYSHKVLEQIDGEDDMDTIEIEPISLSMPVLKELGAQWIVNMATYISNNPQFITNGFVRAGISGALDDNEVDGEIDSEADEESESEEESEVGDESEEGSEVGDESEEEESEEEESGEESD